MTDDIDIDIFGEGSLVELDGPDMVLGLTTETEPTAETVIDVAVERTTPQAPVAEAPTPGMTVTSEITTEIPYALIYRSKSGGPDHVVIQQADAQLACTCWPGTRRVGRGCHAMVAARAILGLPEPDEGPPT